MPLFLFRRRSNQTNAIDLASSEPNQPDTGQPRQPSLQRQSSGVAAAVQERLAREVLRKLRLATTAEEKEDRDIVCSEVFADITGELNDAARESTGTLYNRWYEVLAPYFCRAQEASEALLAVCRQLWGQPFTAPIFALLLHQWLLVHPDAGGGDQRLKHLNILVSGARQLFLGDVETGVMAFKPLYTFIAEQVVLLQPRKRLDDLPAPGRETLAAIAAAFMPYYMPATTLGSALRDFPPPAPPSPGSSPVPGEGADFLLNRIIDVLSKEIRSEAALRRYLEAIASLCGSPFLRTLRTSTRIRLQGELYALTQPGGPRYASRAVNRIAFGALDMLFPHGRRTRRLVNLAFRFLHPQEWPWVWWDTWSAVARAAVHWVRAVLGWRPKWNKMEPTAGRRGESAVTDQLLEEYMS